MFKVTFKPTNKAGKIVANVTVSSGILSLKCTLEDKDGTLYLNGPTTFVGKDKAPKSNGFIPQGWIDKKHLAEVKEEAIRQYKANKAAEEA